MISRRRHISGIIGALLFAGIVRADMVPVFKLETERQQPLRACCRTEVQHTNLSSLYDSPILVDLDLGTVQFLPEAGADVGQTSQIPLTINLTDGPGSVSLCLYALMGLGLCSAPHCVRRLSLGHIPEWYDDAGPFQLGHSLAVSPESLCATLVCCSIQPDETAEPLIPQYHLRTVVSCWRKSQFTPDVIASRGPPLS
jgi:hypothetical protein